MKPLPLVYALATLLAVARALSPAPGCVEGVRHMAAHADGFVVDQWGVLFDSSRPYPGVVEALDLRDRLLGLAAAVFGRNLAEELNLDALEADVVVHGAPHEQVEAEALLATLGRHPARLPAWRRSPSRASTEVVQSDGPRGRKETDESDQGGKHPSAHTSGGRSNQ